jgi:hypothetical protein
MVMQNVVGGISVGGPGVPEPPTGMVAKQWSVAVHSNTYGTFRIYYFRLLDGRTMCYNPAKRQWHIWRPHRNLVVGKTVSIRQAKRMVSKLQQIRKVADAVFPVQHSKKVKKKKR